MSFSGSGGTPPCGAALSTRGGALIGAPFLIAVQSESDALPRVAYSKGSSDDVFWVTFTSNLPSGRLVFSRLVRYAPGAPNNHWLGPIQPVSLTAEGGPLQKTGGIAFDPHKRQFFVTWEGIVAGDWEALGQVWQLSGSTAAPVLTPASGVLKISNSPNAQGAPDVAFDWQHNRYLVVYMGEHPQSEFLKGTWAKMVAFDGAMTPSFSAPIEIYSGGGPIEQGVVYAPEVDRFLTYWTGIAGSRDLIGALLDHTGAIASLFTIMGTPSNEGAADASYNESTRTILVAAQRDQTRYGQGAILTGSGAVIEYFQATAVVPAPGQIESLTPQVAAAAGGRFGVSYINGYTFGYVDVLQAALAGSPGPSPGGPTGPPPCGVEPNPSVPAISLTGVGQSRTIAVTASTATCAWTASASASWISITGGASGAGPGITTFAVSRNNTGAPRSGTVSVGSGSVTIHQAPSLANAALHDMSGDRASDVIWHNVATGRVAVWNLEGWTVKGTSYLTSAAVDTNWRLVGTGDLNGDGQADAVWRHSGTGAMAGWFLQMGTIIATQFLVEDGAAAFEADLGWQVRGVGDLDGDGKSDIIWQHFPSGVLGVWYMDGVNVLSRASFNIGMPDSNWKIAGAGDVNGDGMADVVWQNDANGLLGVWLMNGHAVIWQRLLTAGVSDTNWKIGGVGDTNGDGFADIIWQNMSTGDLGIWFLRNATVLEGRALTIGRVSDTNWHVVGPG